MPPRKIKAADPTPVDAIRHADKRANLPTADAQEFVDPEVEKPTPIRYPRDPTLDPQLVWKGKDDLDGEDLIADAPTIYIQEKVDPRVIVENLRRTAARPQDEPELTLFQTFDGLDDLALVDFYRHEANWSNRLILGDSLNVLASLAERERLRGKVQMIYVDPPYGIKFESNWQVSARRRDVRDGNVADATREVEQIKAFRDTWKLGIHTYLTYLRDRLTIAKDLLTDSGSIFVQIGDENVHLVRSLMDEVLGSENFVSQIVIRKTTAMSASLLGGTVDYILWYARDRGRTKYRPLYAERSDVAEARYDQVMLADGTYRAATAEEKTFPEKRPAGARLYQLGDLTNQRPIGEGDVQAFTFKGKAYRPSVGKFKTDLKGLERLAAAGRIQSTSGGTLRYVRFADDFGMGLITNLWNDISGAVQSRSDPKVYVVQSSTSLAERCMLMTTDPGDLVLDPTCGSGTTAYVAEQWGRRWITIDTSRVALTLARQRLMGGRFPYYLLADSPEGRAKQSELSATPLPPAETKGDVRHGFVYNRVLHVTLKSIANNPDIQPGMSQQQVDAAIRRHAEFENLHDKPYEDPRRVRVAGPFTVESLSPHRSLAVTGGMHGRHVPEEPSNDGRFEQTILDNLRTAGIENGRRNERLTFDAVEPYAGAHVQAVGIRESATEGAPRRVGVTIGSEYGTVDGRFIKDAAREALRAGDDLDLLCVLAFAFDPAVLGSDEDYITSADGFANVAAVRQLGRIPVLLVRMNADLVMGEDLKKTAGANLFTVFGEPDIEIRAEGDELQVVLRGVDVYDPNTGQIRSDDTDQIALWMIDTDYNEESFFVRHCYFTGGQDPYKRLKIALKADIDEEAWASLYRTESRPFSRPENRKIAVKVINDYGDEVMKVLDV